MSQSRNSTDSQALLQSMLQRLKLQPGREGQAYLHTPLPTTAASTGGQEGKSGLSNLQKVDNSPVNGFEFSTNGILSKELRTSAADSNFGLSGGEIQQPGLGCEVDTGLISFSTQKGNTDGDTGDNTGDNRVLGQAIQPGITPTGTGQLLPVQSPKDADITSSERTDGGRMSFGSSTTSPSPGNNCATTNMGYAKAQDQGFTPQVYTWSLRSTDADLNTGSQENTVFHMGNGGYGALAQSKDAQIVPADQKTANSSIRRKQRSSENKTKRWTQKIKERWRDRSGTFGKKGKEEGAWRENQKSEQETEISPQNQLFTAASLVNTSNKERERPLPSLDSSNPSETPLTHTDDSTKEGDARYTSDFEFGLGSFSLLEEIVTGQEWEKFLNPNQSAFSTNQRPSEEVKTLPNPHDGSQSSVSDFSRAQISPDAFQPVSMDVSGGKQQQYVHKEAEQSEPMEDAHTQLDIQSADGGLGQHFRPPSFVQPADVLNNSVLKVRGHVNRKRQHQSAERREERLQTEKMSDATEADRDGSIFSLSQTSSHVMEEAGQSQHDSTLPLYTLNSPPPPISPSSLILFAPAPKGVLRHSMSQDSESSMEIVTKRRRVEENRRVHFSEEVVTIVPPELDMEATDSEEESIAEDDSVTEQECEVEQAAIEEVAPARRPALPAWIKALKRRNTGRKHR